MTMQRLWLAILVGALLATAAIWGGAAAHAPGFAEFTFIGFLGLFGATLAAGVQKNDHGREVVPRRNRESP
jgi:hypothetical protein